MENFLTTNGITIAITVFIIIIVEFILFPYRKTDGVTETYNKRVKKGVALFYSGFLGIGLLIMQTSIRETYSQKEGIILFVCTFVLVTLALSKAYRRIEK